MDSVANTNHRLSTRRDLFLYIITSGEKGEQKGNRGRVGKLGEIRRTAAPLIVAIEAEVVEDEGIERKGCDIYAQRCHCAGGATLSDKS